MLPPALPDVRTPFLQTMFPPMQMSVRRLSAWRVLESLLHVAKECILPRRRHAHESELLPDSQMHSPLFVQRVF